MFKDDSNFFKHCFLFQYPDAPNLFSNVRRPYRPSISTVFRRGWLTNVLGILMVVTGSGLLVWNEVGYKFSSLIDCQCYAIMTLFLARRFLDFEYFICIFQRRTVMMTKALDEGHRSVLVPETTSVVFDENNGKLVLIR